MPRRIQLAAAGRPPAASFWLRVLLPLARLLGFFLSPVSQHLCQLVATALSLAPFARPRPPGLLEAFTIVFAKRVFISSEHSYGGYRGR